MPAQHTQTSDDVSYTTFNGVPLSVTLYDAPYVQAQNINADMGVYAQDKWTLRRLTLTGGVRWDYFNSGIPAQTTPADIWIPARSFAPVPNVPNWNDIDPRFGAAYDLFGNHKTALKASVSRYVSTNIYTFGYNIDPISAGGGNTLTRAVLPTTNINAPPIGNPLNTAPNGDYASPGASNFGQSILTTTYDPNLSSGWGKRPYSWEYTAQVQHQLTSHISLDGGYFRRTYRQPDRHEQPSNHASQLRHVLCHLPSAPDLAPMRGAPRKWRASPVASFAVSRISIPRMPASRITSKSRSRKIFPGRIARCTMASTST